MPIPVADFFHSSIAVPAIHLDIERGSEYYDLVNTVAAYQNIGFILSLPLLIHFWLPLRIHCAVNSYSWIKCIESYSQGCKYNFSFSSLHTGILQIQRQTTYQIHKRKLSSILIRRHATWCTVILSFLNYRCHTRQLRYQPIWWPSYAYYCSFCTLRINHFVLFKKKRKKGKMARLDPSGFPAFCKNINWIEISKRSSSFWEVGIGAFQLHNCYRIFGSIDGGIYTRQVIAVRDNDTERLLRDSETARPDKVLADNDGLLGLAMLAQLPLPRTPYCYGEKLKKHQRGRWNLAEIIRWFGLGLTRPTCAHQREGHCTWEPSCS